MTLIVSSLVPRLLLALSQKRGRVPGKGAGPGEKGRAQLELSGGVRLVGLIEEQGRDMRKRKCQCPPFPCVITQDPGATRAWGRRASSWGLRMAAEDLPPGREAHFAAGADCWALLVFLENGVFSARRPGPWCPQQRTDPRPWQ